MRDNSLRNAVLESMDALVRQDGWAATGLAKVAVEAGISRQSIYNEFGSRQGLVRAWVMFRLDRLLSAIDVIFANSDDTESALRESLTLFFDAFDSSIVETVAAQGTELDDLIPILTDTNQEATRRLSILLGRRYTSLTERDSVVYADAVARLALGHALAPTISHQEAADRIVVIALRVLDDRSTP